MAMSVVFATLIGDLIGSKRADDRPALQRALVRALHTVNSRLEPPQPLQPTVGDEFQGGFSDVATAAKASLLLRLELLAHGETDSRYGLGYGAVTVFAETPSPRSQDGPGWWSARAAIERSKELAESSRTRTPFARTCFERWEDEEPGVRRSEAAALNAFLICRDATVGQMAPRGRRLLLGLMLDQPQSWLAEQEGITQSAVSQNLASSGSFAIEAAQRSLEGWRG